MKGYGGKYLRINLSTGQIKSEALSREMAREYIGGRGFGVKHLYDEIPANTDPLSEDNKLILLPGVLGGTSAMAVSRWLAMTKSPLTGCFARASCGGDFGAWLKFAGYDYVIIEGKANNPVYLYIGADGCQLRDAGELWGKDTTTTQNILEREYGNQVRIACIGPAGENLVKYAAIVTGRRTASRCGVGTVMGNQRLKAVVVRAKRSTDLHDPEEFKRLVKRQLEFMKDSEDYLLHKRYGTTDGTVLRNMLGVFPTRNFRMGRLEGHEQFTGETFEKIRVGEFSCYSCPARCGKAHKIITGAYPEASSEGPEYESLWAFSGMTEVTELSAIIHADSLCDDLGLDTISTGNSIGFAYELFERGIITPADTDGQELIWGNHETMISLVKKIAAREGFGDVLADGTVLAAKRIGKGAGEYAMQVKGLELPGYEPRGLKTTGYGYATSTIGGSHGNGSLAFQELGMPIPREVDRFADDGKADIVIFNQNGSALGEVGCVCAFARSWGPWYRQLFGKMLAAATGFSEFADPDFLNQVGEKLVNQERMFNVRDGFGRAQDRLPRRMTEEPLIVIDGPGDGEMIRHFDQCLDEYYQLRGWTNQGIPTPEKLSSLGLKDLIKDLPPVSTD